MRVSQLLVAATAMTASNLVNATSTEPLTQATAVPGSPAPPLPPSPTTLLSIIAEAATTPTSSAQSTLTTQLPVTRTVTLRPSTTNTYVACDNGGGGDGGGGSLAPCATGTACIGNPWVAGAGPGICVEPVPCGGFAGRVCPDGKWCVDDPRDTCDPKKGGADCIGICV